jgi:hypothetical protein
MRCWKSFVNADKATEHQEESGCEEKPLPDFERLMRPEDELFVQQTQSIASEEDAWWALFQRLIPGMAGRDVDALKLEYSPCEWSTRLQVQNLEIYCWG